MLKQALTEAALALGFVRVRIIAPERLAKWETVARSLNLDLSRRATDPRDAMSGCRSVVQLVYPYRPYDAEPPMPLPSAYYIASNASAKAAKALAAWLEGRGHRATADTMLPEKALAERCGGRYGRNGLIGLAPYGTRVALRSILTDAELEPDPAYHGDALADECENCAACVLACPTGALNGEGHVDRALCLRAQPDSEPFPEPWRHLLGASYIGCDLCQDACPRNARVRRAAPPSDVVAAFDLPKILSGDMEGVADLIGANYARKKRLQARACLIAANLGRSDCLADVQALFSDESELLRDAAAWAAGRL